MGSTTIHSHWELRECLTVEGVRWISYCDFTTHPVKKWGFSLGLILPSKYNQLTFLALFALSERPHCQESCLNALRYNTSYLLKPDASIPSYGQF
jgi:hypothetical protein